MYNVGSLGAGMYNLDSNPILTNVTFSENDASGKDGGAINNDNSNPSLTNVTIYKNRALRGSGLFNSNNSAPTLVNSIIWLISTTSIIPTTRFITRPVQPQSLNALFKVVLREQEISMKTHSYRNFRLTQV